MDFYNWTYVSDLSAFKLNGFGLLEDAEYEYSVNLFKRRRKTKIYLPKNPYESTPKEVLDKIQKEIDDGKLFLVTPWDDLP
jgi:hypothetical protein